MVCSTGRFDRETDHDEISVLEMSSRTIRRLTHRGAIDNDARWSPDGSRIAFMSNDFSRAGVSLCVINIDGTSERCYPFDVGYHMIGWLSASRLLIQASATGRLRYVDVNSWQQRDSDLEATAAHLSPDGEWLLCRCQVGGYHESEWWVAPIDDLSKKRVVRVAGVDPSTVELNWMPGVTSPRYLSTLQLLAPAQPIPARTSYAVTYKALDVRGHALEGIPLTWSTNDSSVAGIDSLGVLRTRKPGHVRVDVTAGGWRSASREYEVVAALETSTAFIERWDTSWTSRWHRFGSPRSRVDEIRGERWFFPNGDGRFVSGATSFETFSVRDGLEIDATVQIPVRHPQWQQLGIALVGFRAPKTLADALKTAGDASPSSMSDGGCGFTYPAGSEGYEYARYFALSMRNPSMMAFGEATSAMQRGETTRVRLRLLADGRCELLVGDQRLSSPPSLRTDSRLSFQIEIFGQSAWEPNAISGLVVRRGSTQ